MLVLRKCHENVMLGKNFCVVFGLNLCLCLKISNAEFLTQRIYTTKEIFALDQGGLRLTSAILRANSVISFNIII